MRNNTIFTLPRSATLPKFETKNDQLLNAALQAVAIPVLETKPLSKQISPSPVSICQDSTLYLTFGTIHKFADQIHFKSEIMSSINSEISKCFVSSTRLVLRQVLCKIDPMTDIKLLFDQIGSFAITEIRAGSRNIEELFMQTMDLFMSCLRESLQASEPFAIDSVKKNALLEIKNLLPILKKYIDPSQSCTPDSLITAVARIFDFDPSKINIRPDYTPEVVYHILHRNSALIPGPLKFETALARQSFVDKEQSKLKSLITVFGLSHPRVTHSKPYIPESSIPNFDRCLIDYKMLVTLCLIHDLQSPPRNLSKQSKSILNECGIIWGIHDWFREIALLDGLTTRLANGDISVIHVKSVLNGVCKLEMGLLPLSDKEFLGRVLKKLINVLRDVLDDVISGEADGSLLNDVVDMVVEVMMGSARIEKRGVINDGEINHLILSDIKASIKTRMGEMRKSLEEEDEVSQTINLFQIFSSDLLTFQEFFSNPICGGHLVWKLAAEEYLRAVNNDIKEISTTTDNFSGHLDIYDQAKKLIMLCSGVGLNSDLFIPIENYFLPALEAWLTQGEIKWNEWAIRAFELDAQQKFQPLNTMRNMNSDSVMDLFTAFQATRSFLQKFEFDEAEKREMLKRKFLKGMHNTLNTYCELLFEDFEALHNSKVGEAKEFTREHIIKFNNVMYAQQLCDELIGKLIETDPGSLGTSKIFHDETKVDGQMKEESTTNTFKIKIIGARNLGIQNYRCPDSYCEITLGGETVGTTPIVKSSCHPFWHAEQIVTLPEAMNTGSLAFLHFEIFHDNPFGNEISCGKCAVFLKDPSIQNFLSHNVVKNLRPQGSLSLRIRREGEVENTQWYVVRTQEVLKFTVEDMVWTFTNQITRMIGDAITKICKETGSKTLFGVSVQKGSEISRHLVEERLYSLFVYIDKTLSLLNQYVDRRFESNLKLLHPAAFSLNSSEVDTSYDAKDSIAPTLKATPTRKDTKIEKAEREQAFLDPVIDYQKPPALINLLWHEILKFCSSLLDSLVSETLSETEVQIVKIVDIIVELLKTIFYCKVPKSKGSKKKENLGLSLKALETFSYHQLRANLESLLSQKNEL